MADRNYFPEDFVPSKFHVICGRGKKSYGHVGNQWFLTVVSSRINDYARADTKQEKSEIVQKLVGEIRDAGGFIRQDEQTGRYFRVAEGEGRDKVSQALRDALKHKYKSSKDVKRTNRKAKRLATRQNSAGSRRGSMGSHSERSVGSGYYSGAEVEIVGSGPSPLLQATTSPAVLNAATAAEASSGQMQQQQPRSKSIGFPAATEIPPGAAANALGIQQPAPQQPAPQQQQQQQQQAAQRSQSISGGPATHPAKAAWNAHLFVIPGIGQNPAVAAPTTTSSAVGGINNNLQKQQQQQKQQGGKGGAPVEAFPVQAFPEIDISALGYNQPHEIARQVSNNDFQGSEFQQHRRPSTGGSSYASTSNNSGYYSGNGSARDYWSSRGDGDGDWDNDEDVDLEFCLDLDDMEQQAAAMGMDFTDMVYASPPRPNVSPGHINASPGHVPARVNATGPGPGPGQVNQRQPSPIIQMQIQRQQQQQQQARHQPSPQTIVNRMENPSPLNLPQQQSSNGQQEQMRLQIEQMLAATQLPNHLQQQQQVLMNLQNAKQQQRIIQDGSSRLTAANLAAINNFVSPNVNPATISHSAADFANRQLQQQLQQQQQQQKQHNTIAAIQVKGAPPQTDSQGRVFYDV